MLPVVQGRLGLVRAIDALTHRGHIVSLPLVDNQDYDLIVDIDGELGKVQVKTCTQIIRGNPVVELKKVRSNKTVNRIHKFDKTLVDYLFVYQIRGTSWFIPTGIITASTSLVLNDRFDSYIV